MTNNLVWLNQSFGSIIKSARESLGWTQNELSRQCGTKKISAMYISQIERGERVPKEEKVLCLASALGIDKKRLLLLGHFEKASPEIRALIFSGCEEESSVFSHSPFLEFVQLAEFLPERHKKHLLTVCKLHLEFMYTVLVNE